MMKFEVGQHVKLVHLNEDMPPDHPLWNRIGEEGIITNILPKRADGTYPTWPIDMTFVNKVNSYDSFCYEPNELDKWRVKGEQLLLWPK
jgi:hypothetical protein